MQESGNIVPAGAALLHGKSYLAIAPEIVPLKRFSVPVGIPHRPSFSLEKINKMVHLEQEDEELW